MKEKKAFSFVVYRCKITSEKPNKLFRFNKLNIIYYTRFKKCIDFKFEILN
jgi:hypothetical protein